MDRFRSLNGPALPAVCTSGPLSEVNTTRVSFNTSNCSSFFIMRPTSGIMMLRRFRERKHTKIKDITIIPTDIGVHIGYHRTIPSIASLICSHFTRQCLFTFIEIYIVKTNAFSKVGIQLALYEMKWSNLVLTKCKQQ